MGLQASGSGFVLVTIGDFMRGGDPQDHGDLVVPTLPEVSDFQVAAQEVTSGEIRILSPRRLAAAPVIPEKEKCEVKCWGN
jgi:hypothetical protein